MFDLQKSSLFFEQMASEHPTLVQNIEIVQENKVQLDASYHRPKQFILNLNNLLRSLLFFVEISTKNSPFWLHDSILRFKDKHRHEFEVLKHLRNVSAHQKLVLPGESLSVGLFRIRSSREYLFKLGFGDQKSPKKYSWDLAMKDTEEVFHDLLTFPSIAFMDLNHSALNECLGITRHWFFKVKFKNESFRIDETVDVYQLAAEFSSKLMDDVCRAYASAKNIVFDSGFAQILSANNHINTLLEIDLYPSLFNIWWEGQFEPLNFGVRMGCIDGERHAATDYFYKNVFENLTPDAQTYRQTLEKFFGLSSAEILEETNLKDAYAFLRLNHWHFKKAFVGGLGDSPGSPSQVMMLQRAFSIFLEECRKQKNCTIESTKDDLNARIHSMLTAVDGYQTSKK